MDSKNEMFQVEFTEEFIEEITAIYDYISTKIKENKAAKRLINKVLDKVLNLSTSPELYVKIGKVDKLKKEYHRMIVKKYVILYTIDSVNKKVFISHIIYNKRNYFKFLIF